MPPTRGASAQGIRSVGFGADGQGSQRELNQNLQART